MMPRAVLFMVLHCHLSDTNLKIPRNETLEKRTNKKSGEEEF